MVKPTNQQDDRRVIWPTCLVQLPMDIVSYAPYTAPNLEIQFIYLFIYVSHTAYQRVLNPVDSTRCIPPSHQFSGNVSAMKK